MAVLGGRAGVVGLLCVPAGHRPVAARGSVLSLRYSFRVRGRGERAADGPGLAGGEPSDLARRVHPGGDHPEARQGDGQRRVHQPARPPPAGPPRGDDPDPVLRPPAIRAAITEGRAALDRGDCLGIFPEGQISRNGLLGPFYRGIEVILHGRDDVPVIPVALDNLWGSVFSRSGGRFFFKRPARVAADGQRRLRPPRAAAGDGLRPPPGAAGGAGPRLRASPLCRSRRPRRSTRALPALGAPDARPPDRLDGRHPPPGVHQIGHKDGTVGHPVPGVAVRVVDDAGRPSPPRPRAASRP